MEKQCAFCVIPSVKDPPGTRDPLGVEGADALLVLLCRPGMRFDAFLHKALPFGGGKLLGMSVGSPCSLHPFVWVKVLVGVLDRDVPQGGDALLCLLVKLLPESAALHWLAWLLSEVVFSNPPTLFASEFRAI